jgi:non-specific serine/threonine protein kinase
MQTAAAAAVCIAAPAHDVLEGIGSLLDKSLLRAEQAPTGTLLEEGPRLGMLATVREFGLERLAAAGEAEEIRGRHARYYLALAEEAEPQLTGAGQAAWLARLEREHDDLRAALRWCSAEEGDVQAGLRLAAALWQFWYRRGYLSEGRRWLEATLHRSAQHARGEAVQDRVFVRAHIGAGHLAGQQADYERATVLFQTALARARELGDAQGMAEALHNLGVVASHGGDTGAARQMCEEALALRRASGDRHGIVKSLTTLGLIAHQGGEEGASALLEEALALSRQVGDHLWTAAALGNLGWVKYGQGDYARASALYREALTLARAIGDRWEVVWLLEDIAMMGAALGQPEWAARLFGATAALREALGTSTAQSPAAGTGEGRQAARAALGEAGFAAAWAAGRAMTLEQAVAAALADGAGVVSSRGAESC